MKKRKIESIEEAYNSIFDSYGTDYLKEHIKKIIELDVFLPYDSTFFCVTNTQDLSFEYISKNVKSCLGIEPAKMKEGGMKAFWGQIHPDDVESWLAALTDLMKFTLTHVDQNDRQRMSYTWNYRIKNNKDQFVSVIQNTTPLAFDSSGKPIVGLAHYTVLSPNIKIPLTASAKLLTDNNVYETIYYNSYAQKLLSSGVTNRERDIIRLLIQDYSSKQIADFLYISSATVDTHRRNILKKLNLSSTGELIGLLKSRPEIV